MAQHNQILTDFKDKMPNFDFQLEDHRLLVNVLVYLLCCVTVVLTGFCTLGTNKIILYAI